MAFGGPSQVPAYRLPHDQTGKDAFKEGRRFDAGVKATIILVAAGAIWFLGMWLLSSELWYLALVLWAAAVGIFILWR
jgi:hypothetical protein